MGSLSNFHPPVSIIIPVYNGGNYLEEAINSALAQDYDNVEVLVINDGSTDEQTERIALSYGDKIRYFRKSNGGVASALNFGIREMRGEYFSWLSHDDIYMPTKISAQISHLEKQGDRQVIVFSGFYIIDSDGKECNRIMPLDRYSRKQLETPLFALFHGMISGCSLLIHKSHFGKAGLFCESLPTTQDFDLWFRIMRESPCSVGEGVLHKVRVHKAQGSQVHKKVHQQESDALWINMMQMLTDEEKTALNGSVQGFYRNIYWLLLKYTQNHNAMKYARRRAVSQVGFRGLIARIRLGIITLMMLTREVLGLVRRRALTHLPNK